MEPFPVGSHLHVQYRILANEQILRNNFYYKCFEQGTATVLNTLYASITDALDGNPATNYLVGKLRDCLSASVQITQIRYQVITPVRYRAYLVATNISGTRAGDCTAQNVQASITKMTDFSGRDQVGGIRIGGLSNADYGGGNLVAALKIKMADLISAHLLILSTDVAGAWNPVLFHRFNPVVQSTSTDLTKMVAQDTLRTQRSRTRGHGE